MLRRERCQCEGWFYGMPQIEAAIMMALAHDVKYTGPVFGYCPYCGAKLEPISQPQTEEPCETCGDDGEILVRNYECNSDDIEPCPSCSTRARTRMAADAERSTAAEGGSMLRRYKCDACSIHCILSTRSKPQRAPNGCMWIGKAKWEKYNQRLEAYRRRVTQRSAPTGQGG